MSKFFRIYFYTFFSLLTLLFLVQYITVFKANMAIESKVLGASNIYYVSTTGSDSDSGTIDKPWKTLSKASNTVTAGDIVYLREGTYNERLAVETSGTSSSQITISGYPGESAIIDGSSITLGCYDFLIVVHGSYVNLENLKVMNSTGGGMYIGGTGSSIKNISLAHMGETGAVLAGTNNIADGITVTDNGYKYGSGCTTWGGALCTVGKDSIIRNSLSYNNVGEGLAAYGGSSGATIEDNISYNNQSVGLYLDSSTGVTARRNLVYHSPDVSYSSRGITVGGETGVTSNSLIANNMVMGTFVNFEVDSNITTLNGVDVSYNTFVNAKGKSDYGYNMGVYFRDTITSFSNSYFRNNIVVEEASDRVPVSVPTSHSGLTFSHNAWGKTPNAAAVETGDVTCGSSSCGLSKNGTYSSGSLTSGWFKILSTSPAKDAAEVIFSVTEDFFGTTRGNSPDMGAHEFVSSSTSTPTPTATPTLTPTPTPTPTATPTPTPTSTPAPKLGDANGDLVVNEADYGIWFTNFGQTTTSGISAGDFNNSGKVDGADYVIWLNNFGS